VEEEQARAQALRLEIGQQRRAVQLDRSLVEMRLAERLAWQLAERAERGVDDTLEGVLKPG
jgi:hypothetical protein